MGLIVQFRERQTYVHIGNCLFGNIIAMRSKSYSY